MHSRHLVDAELDAFLDEYQPLPPDRDALPALRAQRAALVREVLRGLPPDAIDKTEHLVPGRDGAPPVRVLLYRPSHADRPSPVYLNIHGGGLVAGLPEQDEVANRRIAALLGCIVVAPAYRLAPETTFPGPLNDCCAALDWIVHNAATFHADVTRIAVGGSSAGGGLAAALALKTRDEGTVRLRALMLVFPMLDDRTGSSRATSLYAGEFVWTSAQNCFGWSCYLGKPAGGSSPEPYSAPGRADDLAGLPPVFVGCGALDLFLDENIAFAQRLMHTGIPCELHIYPGAYHAFQYVAAAEVTKNFQRDFLGALGRALRTAA